MSGVSTGSCCCALLIDFNFLCVNLCLSQRFGCDLCDQSFDSSAELEQHQQQAHSGELVVVGEEEMLQEPLLLTTQGLLQASARYTSHCCSPHRDLSRLPPGTIRFCSPQSSCQIVNTAAHHKADARYCSKHCCSLQKVYYRQLPVIPLLLFL